jgi:hypothetical protein
MSLHIDDFRIASLLLQRLYLLLFSFRLAPKVVRSVNIISANKPWQDKIKKEREAEAARLYG